MRQKITLNCKDGIQVSISADVVRGIAIHRPVHFEVDGRDNIVLDANGEPTYKFGAFFWRLTHVNSGLSIMHARTKEAARQARAILQTIDLDYVASLDKEQRLRYLPDDHELRQLMEDSDTWLPPNWEWA